MATACLISYIPMEIHQSPIKWQARDWFYSVGCAWHGVVLSYDHRKIWKMLLCTVIYFPSSIHTHTHRHARTRFLSCALSFHYSESAVRVQIPPRTFMYLCVSFVIVLFWGARRQANWRIPPVKSYQISIKG
jgi:hypothetical protein